MKDYKAILEAKEKPLSVQLKIWRDGRPHEAKMDEFIALAKELEKKAKKKN